MDAPPSVPSQRPTGPAALPRGPTESTMSLPEPASSVSVSRRGPPENIARLRDMIQRALLQSGALPDFPSGRIPSAEFNPTVNAAMHALTVQRDHFDAALLRMVNDEAEDGTPVLDPNRDYEDEYHHLSAQHNAHNRALYTIYAQYLDRPSRPYQRPVESSANMAMTLHAPQVTGKEPPPCPYGHIAELPSHPIMRPNMVVIDVTEATSQALFARLDPTATEVSALADSGASYVLFTSKASLVRSTSATLVTMKRKDPSRSTCV
jgi:hypothetical protein